MARSLARLAKAIDYTVTVVAPGAGDQHFPAADVIHQELDQRLLRITPQTYVIVSTQGEYDEKGLGLALEIESPYIAFVASKVKAEKLFDYLRRKGVSPERLSRVQAPAGLEIGAVSPEEIAVSILAEIVRVGRTTSPRGASPKRGAEPLPEMALKDPVCGMIVEASRAKHKSEYQGSTVYFCCPYCKQAFDKEPERYLAAVSG